MPALRFFALLCLGGFLFGCAATRPVTVVEKEQFSRMATRMTKELQARNLLTSDGSYKAPLSLAGFSDYGETLFRRLSPSFMLSDPGDVYLGDNFAATLSSRSTVRRWPNGFYIEHPSQKITLNMVALADWNNDGEDEWIISCLVEPKRGGRTRDYYVLIPQPRKDEESLKGTVAAVYECFGLACTLYVRDSKNIERTSADPLLPPTEVQDVVPGLQPVTDPPKKGSSGKRPAASGLEERNL